MRPPHTDEAGFLYLAGKVLDGMRHGSDFFEINPPLAIWLSIPPVLLERYLGVPAWTGWIGLVILTVFGVLLICNRLQGRNWNENHHRAGFLLGIGFVTLLLPLQEFSEREHLALLLVLPFLILASARVRGVVTSPGVPVAVGLMAGICFSLKPHFLVTWVLLEVWLLLRLRSRSLQRPELWTVVTVGAAYLVLVFLLVPYYVPMAIRLAPVYQAYLYNPAATVLLMAGPVLLFMPGFALAARANGPASDPLRDALTLGFLGFLAAAVLQQKGLDYHFLAAEGAGFLLLVRVWQTRPLRLGWKPSALVLRLGFCLILGIPVLRLMTLAKQITAPGGLRYYADPDYPEVLSTVGRLAGGQPILSLSSNMNDGWPLALELGVRWGSRYMHFWPMAAAYHDEILARPLGVVRPRPYSKRSGQERAFSDELVEDLERFRPMVLIVVQPDSIEVLGGHARRFDYMGYFGSDPRFNRILRNYREAARVGIYRLLVRDSAATESDTLPKGPPLLRAATVTSERP
jgi:hypothetical protein